MARRSTDSVSERATSPGLFARVRATFDRVLGNPIHWTPYQRALAMQLLIAPFVVPAAIIGRYLLHHPEIQPFVDRTVMRVLVYGMYGFLAVAAVTGVVGVLQARRGRSSRLFPHVVVQLYFILWGTTAYLHGLAHSPFWVIFPLVAISALLLFDMRVAGAGIVTALAIAFGSTVLERAGVLPYAPLISEKPFGGQRMPDSWVWPPMIWPPLASLAAFWVFALVLKRNHEQQVALAAANARLEAELRDAARYARSVLPEPMPAGAPVQTAWSWVPCRQLGGDLLTYFELDPGRRYGIAVVDVCGHGVGGALHAVSATQTLRRNRLPGVDRSDPAAVLGAMNDAFPMEEHDGLFFTLWYGVLDVEAGILRYASGGHPPALLFAHGRTDGAPAELSTRGPIVGAMSDVRYQTAEVKLPAGGDLFVFSDGVFELTTKEGSQLDRESFHRELEALAARDDLRPDEMYARALRITGLPELEDDFTLVHVRIRARAA